MAVTDIFPVDPSYAVPQMIDHKVLVSEFDSGQEQRNLKWANPKRRYRITSKTLNDTEMATLRDFWLARQGAFDPFIFLPPKNHDRLITGLAVGTGDAATTVFNLGNSATPPYYYRVDLGAGNRNAIYYDGTPQGSGFTFSNDDGTKLGKVTFDTAPGSGVVVTCDIDRYLVMRFQNRPLDARLIAFAAGDFDMEIAEIFRDSI